VSGQYEAFGGPPAAPADAAPKQQLDDGTGVETPAEIASTVAGADEDRTGEQPNP
jgi:hypothetical protein